MHYSSSIADSYRINKNKENMKVALVTGGTKGMGLGIVRMLLKRNYYVYATYSSDENAAQAFMANFSEYEGKYTLCKVNNADYEQVRQLTEAIKEKGRVDCMVLNAGQTLRKPLKEIENHEWEMSLNVNLSSNVYIIRDLFDVIVPGARIVFIGSMMGVHPHATSLAYGVSKAAVHALATNLVKEFEGTGTTVNAIAPGFIETEWQKNKPDFIRKNICDKTALHRFGEIDEIVNVVEMCLDNQFVNGSVLEVHGGYCFK